MTFHPCLEQQRPSTPHPSKSAVFRLLAAALGIRRYEDEKHQALAQAYGFAVRVDSAGVALRDFHTTQISKGVSRLKHLTTRCNELEDRENLHTVLSARDYRCDSRDDVVMDAKRAYQDARECPSQAQLVQQAGPVWLEERAVRFPCIAIRADEDHNHYTLLVCNLEGAPCPIGLISY